MGIFQAFSHESDAHEKKTRSLQVKVTETFYEILDALRMKEGSPNMPTFLYKIIGQYWIRSQVSETMKKDDN